MGTRISPLHSVEGLAERMRETGEYPDPVRGTGRTTIGLLRTLTSALANPYQVHAYRDHHVSTNLAGYSLYEELLRDKIKLLGLRAVYTRSYSNRAAEPTLEIIFGKPITVLGAEGWREVHIGS